MMQQLAAYREKASVQRLLERLKQKATGTYRVMEICGGQTHSLVKSGLIHMLPHTITMIHGPGCPVCVTPSERIDQALELASRKRITLCSYGDMLRVPGSRGNLLEAKARGADIRMVYSPLEAVLIAEKHPENEVIFFAVGFETTAPANGLAVMQAKKKKLKNFSLLTAQVMVPPAMRAILSDPEQKVDGFLAAGHVCTVTGCADYKPIARRYGTPIAVTGFEPVELLLGLEMVVHMINQRIFDVRNAYKRVASERGNAEAQRILETVFEVFDAEWRGIGTLPSSGLRLQPDYAAFDADRKFDCAPAHDVRNTGCIAGEILKGMKKPWDCPLFGMECTPLHPQGAPMVSSEGACAAYYQYEKEWADEI